MECVVESLIWIGLGLVKVQLARSMICWLLDAGEVTMGDFGKWRVEKMRDSSTPLIVRMGVDQSLSDEQVVNRVMKELRGLLSKHFDVDSAKRGPKRCFL